MNSRKLLIFIVLLGLFSIFHFSVSAQGDDFLGIEDFTVQRISGIITGFACWLIGAVLAIMVIFLIWAGIKFFLARGNDTAVGDAKKNLTWTLVGILVILATNVIIATVANALGGDYSYLPLNCGPIADTSARPGTCRGPEDCPTGSTCQIGAEGWGYCIFN
jgi:hypothetical protein